MSLLTKLTNQASANGFTHRFVVTHDDLTETTDTTAQSLTVACSSSTMSVLTFTLTKPRQLMLTGWEHLLLLAGICLLLLAAFNLRSHLIVQLELPTTWQN